MVLCCLQILSHNLQALHQATYKYAEQSNHYGKVFWLWKLTTYFQLFFFFALNLISYLEDPILSPITAGPLLKSLLLEAFWKCQYTNHISFIYIVIDSFSGQQQVCEEWLPSTKATLILPPYIIVIYVPANLHLCYCFHPSAGMNVRISWSLSRTVF